jgi:hypothetical protein
MIMNLPLDNRRKPTETRRSVETSWMLESWRQGPQYNINSIFCFWSDFQKLAENPVKQAETRACQMAISTLVGFIDDTSVGFFVGFLQGRTSFNPTTICRQKLPINPWKLGLFIVGV